jgi:hypothetical protein
MGAGEFICPEQDALQTYLFLNAIGKGSYGSWQVRGASGLVGYLSPGCAKPNGTEFMLKSTNDPDV